MNLLFALIISVIILILGIIFSKVGTSKKPPGVKGFWIINGLVFIIIGVFGLTGVFLWFLIQLLKSLG